jgi:preprotein translocase subunit SecD
METNPDGTPHSGGVAVYRERPTMVNVNKEPFLTEGDVQEAAVVDALGGFVIKIQFNRHGSLVLENTTTAYRGRRIAIQSQFGESRWLAAPVIASRIVNGTYVFTPDASREEAERIVRGLNKVAAEIKKRSRF